MPGLPDSAELSELLRVVLALVALAIEIGAFNQTLLSRRALRIAGVNGVRVIVIGDKLRGCWIRIFFASMLLLSGSILMVLPRGAESGFTLLSVLTEITRWGWVLGALILIYTGIMSDRSRRQLLSMLSHREAENEADRKLADDRASA